MNACIPKSSSLATSCCSSSLHECYLKATFFDKLSANFYPIKQLFKEDHCQCTKRKPLQYHLTEWLNTLAYSHTLFIHKLAHYTKTLLRYQKKASDVQRRMTCHSQLTCSLLQEHNESLRSLLTHFQALEGSRPCFLSLVRPCSSSQTLHNNNKKQKEQHTSRSEQQKIMPKRSKV